MTIPQELLDLLKKFDANLEEHTSPSFNEDTVKSHFIEPFFELLGWDIANRDGKPEAWRDVLREHSVPRGPTREAPDYIFKIGKTRVFILEAKKPAVRIKQDASAALQVRRYGWNSKLPIAILTNFLEFAVYDCRQRPKKNDGPEVGLRGYYLYKDYPERWDDFLNCFFARSAVERGSLDKFADIKKAGKGAITVDNAFLQEIESWRKLLAANLALRNPRLDSAQLNFAVQMTIDRIVFLRIAEDRGIEDLNRLLALTNGTRIYPRLFKLFETADDRYNSGLFHFREEKDRPTQPDRISPDLQIDDDKLRTIIRGLYDNFYDFSLIPVEILGQVYERFLGNLIVLTEGGAARVREKPEVKKAGGVFYTPSYVVDYIVSETVEALLEGKDPLQAAKLRVLDPACGSGSFLLGAYQKLLDWHLDYYSAENPRKYQKQIYPILGGGYRLTVSEKKRILRNNIFGVDIDPQAVEVTKLSLLLKVLENETDESLKQLKLVYRERALPDLDDNIKCGNSLIGTDFFLNHQLNFLDDEDRVRLNAFDWKSGFPDVFTGDAPGFDAVIGNPPYVRQEGLGSAKEYFLSHYRAYRPTADLYVAFIEKSLTLLKKKGLLGMIVSNKWLRAAYGRALRELIGTNVSLLQILDLAGLPVFPGATVRTIIMICSPIARKGGSFRYMAPISAREFTTISTGKDMQRFFQQRAISLSRSSLKPEGWTLAPAPSANLVDHARKNSIPLRDHIKGQPFFGIKTGLNEAFIIDRYTRDQLLRDDPASAEIIKPALTGRDVRRYRIDFGEKYLIWTYLAVPIEKYPAVFEHLKKYQARLKKRQDQGNHWWELRTCDYYGRFEQPKIIYPDIAKNCRFALDREGYFSTNTTYFIPGSDLYLLGVLNSRLAEFLFKRSLAGLEGGGSTYLRFFGQYIEEFPMRVIKRGRLDRGLADQVRSRVGEMITLQTKLSQIWLEHERTVLQRQIESIDRSIDELVYKIYGLSKDQIVIVESESYR